MSIVHTAARAREIYEQQAKERMLSGKKSDPKANCPEGQSRDKAGEAAGVSGSCCHDGNDWNAAAADGEFDLLAQNATSLAVTQAVFAT